MYYFFTIQKYTFFFSGVVTYSGVVAIREIHHWAIQVDNNMSVWEGSDKSIYDLKK